MKNTRYSVISVMLVLVGCVPSLHELYTDETLVFDPSIAGRWQQEDNEAVWEFVADAGNKSYALTVYEDEKTKSELTAHLTEINGKRFFDFYPADDAEIEAGDLLKFHLISGHLFVRVEQAEGQLHLGLMNAETVDKLLENKPELVKHERLKDDRVVLTDGPKGLRAFVAQGLEVDEFFVKPLVLKRITAAEPEPSR